MLTCVSRWKTIALVMSNNECGRLHCVGGCRQPSSNLYFIIATIMIIIIKAI
eukprot:COSAG01_NODE_2435_length_7701_cov_7.604709_9_plen_52_part_00